MAFTPLLSKMVPPPISTTYSADCPTPKPPAASATDTQAQATANFDSHCLNHTYRPIVYRRRQQGQQLGYRDWRPGRSGEVECVAW